MTQLDKKKWMGSSTLSPTLTTYYPSFLSAFSNCNHSWPITLLFWDQKSPFQRFIFMKPHCDAVAVIVVALLNLLARRFQSDALPCRDEWNVGWTSEEDNRAAPKWKLASHWTERTVKPPKAFWPTMDTSANWVGFGWCSCRRLSKQMGGGEELNPLPGGYKYRLGQG